MKFLFDLFPVLVFFAAYKAFDIFVATAAAIGASFVQLAAFWLKYRRFETMHVVTLCALVVFGGMTIALRDPVFIKWKTTIVNWIFAAVLLYSQFYTKRTVMEILLGSKLHLPAKAWRSMNFNWGVFFLIVGALNIYVAFYFALDLDAARREEIWVNFKVFGVIGMTFAFMIFQMFRIMRYIKPEPTGKDT